MQRDSIRPPAVAGTFYPGDEKSLREMVDGLLNEATSVPRSEATSPKALIVPHAGYIYSGPIAASAYAMVKPIAGDIERVVLLGPSHRVYVRGLALPEAEKFSTPLGIVDLDAQAIESIRELPQVCVSAQAHASEHSLEVQLPFLQRLFPRFKLVPLAVGDAQPGEVAQVLNWLWGGKETLILISSDLSHYHPYREARQIDGATAQSIVNFQGPIDYEQACGAMPINGILLAAAVHRLRSELLDLRNSGDTAGDTSQVVGYGAFAFTSRDA